ncbi:trypsin-like peptidase domain-containing protein [Streptomyces sp. NPDC006739]|uniref:VMAP-C domain-containing protein n=1 Tax=Streptomyces sp. NPDC006739 TaxID=3364763 RepID=UPI0036C62792
MSAFDEMVRPSLGRIGPSADGYATDRDATGRDAYWGSGFFIAPGYLLTCAHVVGKGGAGVCRGESAMGVTWQERTADGSWRERTGTGTAVLVAPGPDAPGAARDAWPFPDLALVEVSGADDVRCLWLSDREPGSAAPVGLYGWSLQTGELGVRHGIGDVTGSDARALLLGGNLPIGGLSGGPVLDLRYGSVIGVIKGRRREEGVAVPVTALHELLDLPGGARILRAVRRGHDLHHVRLLDDPSPYPNWTTLQATLPGQVPSASGITVESRARLYGHLAHLPPPAGPGEIVHLVDEVKEQVRGERLRSLVLQNVRTWREGAGLLHGLRTLDPGGGGTLVDLDAVLLYAAKVARKTVRERPDEVNRERLRAFSDWLTGQADGHRHWAVGEAVHYLLDGLFPSGGRSGSPGSGDLPGAPPSGLLPVGPPMGGLSDVARAGAPCGAQPAADAVGSAGPPPPTPASTLTVPSAPAPVPSAPAPVPTPPAPVPSPPAPGSSAAAPSAPAPAPALVTSVPAPTPTAPTPTAPTPTTPTPAAPPPSPPAAPPATRTDVLVRVGAAMYDGRYPWSVQLLYDGQDVTPVDGDDRGVPAEELGEVLREPLALALSQGDHGEHLAAVEVFLPRTLFDLPVDDWQLVPDGPGGGPGAEDDDADLIDERSIPLGLRRSVVIRDVRRSDRQPSPEWRRRRRGVALGPMAHEPLHGRSPADGHPPGARPSGKYPYYRALSAMGDACVPVYCGPVGSGEGLAALKDALMAGHSLVLWRRDAHDHDECKAFHQQAADLLGLARHADALHGPVRDLRIRLADPETARPQGLRGKLAVLFDPPDRPPYGTEIMRPPPLAAPGG